jgi:hypothetical protein
LSDSEKRKVEALARWPGVKRQGRSKAERIKIKMLRSSNSGKRRIKRVCVGSSKRGKGRILLLKAKVYSWIFARARGLLNITLFFLLLIGFKG